MSKPHEPPVRPMTLGDMRENGVRGLYVVCGACGYKAVVNADCFADDVQVPSIGPRMWCKRCRHLGTTAVPNWIERQGSLPAKPSARTRRS
jgi:hypothetical protein